MKRRTTFQKEMVIQAVNTLKNHATAEEIYQLIAKDYPSIGRGTVYRNLNILSAEGQIRKIEMPGGPDRFDHICESHYHVKCIKCRRLFDVDMDIIPDLEGKIKDTQGFEFLSHHVFFQGLCPECKEK